MSANLVVALAGWAAGMLVNYLSDVLPVYRRIQRPACLHCGQHFAQRNYWIWPRRCPHCGRRRSSRTWLVEIGAVVLALWFWNSPQMQMHLGLGWGAVLLIYFAVVVVIDIEWRLILHPVSVAGAILGLAVGVSLHGWMATLLGGLLGYGIMFGFYYLGAVFMRLINSRRGEPSDEVALGYGDVNLTGILGLILGFPQILIALVLGLLLGGVFSLALVLVTALARRYRTLMAIPYAPFLVLGAMMILYWPALTQRIFAGLSPYL